MATLNVNQVLNIISARTSNTKQKKMLLARLPHSWNPIGVHIIFTFYVHLRHSVSVNLYAANGTYTCTHRNATSLPRELLTVLRELWTLTNWRVYEDKKCSRITVEDLKIETGVTDDQLNQKCTEEHLKKVASSVGNYTKFASGFHLPQGVKSRIRVDQSLSYNQKTEAVFLWWHENVKNSTYLIFVQVSLNPIVSEKDVAREMCRLCAGN